MTHIRIIENNHSKKNYIKRFHPQRRQLRESRLFDLLVELKELLENSDKNTDYDYSTLMNKADEIDRKYRAIKKFYSNLTHNGRHSSYNVDAMIADKMGYKAEFASKYGLEIDTLTKIIKKFQDKRGKPDLDLLYRYRNAEDATNFLNATDVDISWLDYVDDARDDLTLFRYTDDEKSKTQKDKVQKRIKRVFPEMRNY